MSTQPSQTNQPTANIFEQFEEAKKASGKYLKLVPGEKRILQFNLSKIEIVDSEYQGKKTGGKSIQFTVLDPKEPQAEKILSMGVKKAEGIMALLKAGKALLDIQKIGLIVYKNTFPLPHAQLCTHDLHYDVLRKVG